MKKIWIALVMPLILAACQPQEKEKSLLDQVMEVHDAVMPKMGDLHNTKKQLLKKAEEVEAVDPELAEKLKKMATDVETASEDMMQWMRDFDPVKEGSEQELKQYFENKKEAIQKVANDMNQALEEGKKALE